MQMMPVRSLPLSPAGPAMALRAVAMTIRPADGRGHVGAEDEVVEIARGDALVAWPVEEIVLMGCPDDRA